MKKLTLYRKNLTFLTELVFPTHAGCRQYRKEGIMEGWGTGGVLEAGGCFAFFMEQRDLGTDVREERT